MLNSKQMIYDVIIIGAGFSGCVLAKYLDKQLSVLLIDQNNLILKKFLMTGKGYANITNTAPINEFMNNIIDNNKFMYSSLTKYNSQHILQMCDEMQIKYIEKSLNRIHLKDSNEKFKEIFLNELLAKQNLELKMNCKITSTEWNYDHFVVTNRNIETFYGKNLVIATGGMSYGKLTGSDGYGYVLAKQFKHTIKTVFPIGVGIEINDADLLQLQASANDNICIKVYDQTNKIICEETGELMITHFGLGGPVIRRVSGYISQQLLKFPSVKIKICFINEQLILNEIKTYKRIDQCFRWFNQKILDYLFWKFDINWRWETANLKKSEINLIIKALSEYELVIRRTRPINEAINTGGGINLKELNPSTFMSKLQTNLYFCGEIIDVNPRTNGYNLTVCYSSGRTIADDINKNMIGNK